MPRSQPGAVITDPEAVADNAVHLAKEGITVVGKKISIDTLCLHGDNPQAVANANMFARVWKTQDSRSGH